MKQTIESEVPEDKELLLKDLCARLPYKPIVQIDGCGIWNLRGIDHDDSAELRDSVIVWHGKNYPSSKTSFPIINCKPYLFPLSIISNRTLEEISAFVDAKTSHVIIEFFNSRHIDYRGLIEKGLAIDATELNIY